MNDLREYAEHIDVLLWELPGVWKEVQAERADIIEAALQAQREACEESGLDAWDDMASDENFSAISQAILSAVPQYSPPEE